MFFDEVFFLVTLICNASDATHLIITRFFHVFLDIKKIFVIVLIALR